MKKIPPDLLILPTVAFMLSAVMTWANVGFGELFLARWGRNFVTSLVILPLVLISLGALDKRIELVFASLHWAGRTLVVSLLTAFVMESVLALVITMVNNPWDMTFVSFWWIAFSRSIPVGLLIGLFMGFYMKPKMDQMRTARAAQR
ncbi:MAG: DUF2798 domain-containing protein [Undibacterium sp.]|nr:DUF2798 domain-containing protein [Undibacterium sp.]